MDNDTMSDGHRVPLMREELVLEGSAKNPQIAVHQKLDRLKYNRIKKPRSSLPQQPGVTGPSLTRPDIAEVPDPNDNVLMYIVPAKIRTRIFDVFPLRVIKLPEMKLMERSSVVEYIIQNKLSNLTNEIDLTTAKAIEDVSAGLTVPSHRATFEDMGIAGFVEDVTKFAVLSHTWGQDEPNYEDFLLKRNTTDSDGYKKLEVFCRVAHEQYGVEFAWADTVCINKLSSSELDESIRSMFVWYRESFICIIYLAETNTLLDLPLDRWFSRGWTLQELLASLRIKFYNRRWQPLTNLRNEKLDPRGKPHPCHPDYASRLRSFDETHMPQLELLSDGISAATGIPIDHICDFRPGLLSPPLPARMKWIARRSTMRPEDIAYSMMGILGVSIPIAYGEGSERAFFRLFRAALEVDWSPSWFLWGGKPISSHIHPSRMIPSSPACYLCWDPECDPRSSFKKEPITFENIYLPPQWDPRNSGKREPIALTNTGLPVRVLVVPARVTYIDARHAAFGINEDAIITCLLSDDTVKMMDIPHGVMHNNGEHQFALGILDYDFDSGSTPQRIYAILLRRYHGPYRFPPGTDQQVHKKWLYGNWERWGTGGIISFRLKDCFRGLEVRNLTRFRVSRSEVGWKDVEGEEFIVPQIELLSLYL